METTKNFFYFIGAILAIVAFIKTVLEPSLNRNREKWKKVLDVVTDVDFQWIEHGTLNYQIKGENLQRVERLVYDYGQKADYTQFHGLFSNIYSEYFEELIVAHSEYRDLVQVNEWLPSAEGDWKFNKEAFARETGFPHDYSQHIYKAETAAKKMRHAFKKLEALSDLELWQSLMARKFVSNRIPPLSQ